MAEPAVDRLTRVADAQQGYAPEDRQEEDALSARDRAEADLRRTYIGVTGGYVADAILAGRDDIADKLRPTSNRRKGQPEDVDREIDIQDLDADDDDLDDDTGDDPTAGS